MGMQVADMEDEMGRIQSEHNADGAYNEEESNKILRQVQETYVAVKRSSIILEELLEKAQENVVMQAVNQNQGWLHNITLGGIVYGQQNAIVNGGTWTQNFGYRPT